MKEKIYREELVTENNALNTDVLIIGAGPAGLATAIHLANILKNQDTSRRIMIIEKGSAVGSHILSGTLIKPDVFKELLPDVNFSDIPFDGPVKKNNTVLLFEKQAILLPFHAPYMGNKGNYTASLGQLCKYLATVAEEKGVEIYPGFAVDEILYRDEKVVGVKTKDTGENHRGEPLPNFQPGTSVYARITIFAEGTRGSLTRKLINKFNLDKDKNKPMFSLACKELWSVPPGNIEAGHTYHTLGYPAWNEVFGGGFIYAFSNNRVSVGLVLGLDYKDPTFDIHAAFQIWKKSAFVSKILKGGKLLEYGAKTLSEGGWYAIPKLYVDNAMIVGDSAGLIAMPALKGIHLAIRSGMLAAQTAAEALAVNDTSEVMLRKYEMLLKQSDIYKAMYPVRNFRQSFANGLIPGAILFATQLITGGNGLSGRLKSHSDAEVTRTVENNKRKSFQERFKDKLDFDKILTFDKVTNVFYSGAHHDEEQLVHLHVNNPDKFKAVNIEQYGVPCRFFCPADVYELHTDKQEKKEFRIHAENCVHCKTCDIKSPENGITWMVPNGDNGPEYQNM